MQTILEQPHEDELVEIQHEPLQVLVNRVVGEIADDEVVGVAPESAVVHDEPRK